MIRGSGDKSSEAQRRAASNYYQNHFPQESLRGKRYQMLIKVEVLSHYSNGTPQCNRCAESRIECLSIDHEEGEGSSHRRKVSNGRGGYAFYKWLKNHNFPAGFQVLCMNCQWIKKIANHEHRRSRYADSYDITDTLS